MSNGNLNCSATNCGHNNSGLCYAGGINVGGHNANTTSNTYCSSFVDQDNTYCPDCNEKLLTRGIYTTTVHIDDNKCDNCGKDINIVL